VGLTVSRPSVLACALSLLLLAAPPASASLGPHADADTRWESLHEALLPRIASTRLSPLGAGEDIARLRGLSSTGLPQPSMIVVGFTGGLERHDSAVSGIVRLRHAVHADLGDVPEVALLTYNNFNWRQAGRDVIQLARVARDRDVAPTAGSPGPAPLPQPIIVAYGHSWGGGSIAKFARQLADEGLEISLAMYIDAFTVRNPRLPSNIRYAVNFYQRTGILRGLPLRGKRRLVPEAPDATTVIGSFRITPETEHFGWHWNLVQPLLYRHHHRISHDVRLQRYLFEIVVRHLELLAGDPAPPQTADIVAGADL
jgi:hypothetical protein